MNKRKIRGRLLQEGYSALHLAFMYSKEDTILFLMTQKGSADLIMSPGGSKKQTCLHFAAARHKALVLILHTYTNYFLNEEAIPSK